MREGLNPNKDKIFNEEEFLHQIIIPVYIPHKKEYFEDSFKILKICIQSLRNTSHSKTFISIISNGSCSEVEKYLLELYFNKEVQEVITTSNVGKYNAILKGLAGHKFQLVTITDADVLFKANWQRETYKIFDNFSKVGAVGLIPQFLAYQYYSENLLFDNFFSNRVNFGKVEEPKALAAFYDSLGWESNYPMERLKYALYIKNKGQKALVGAGHVVTTYRRELFDNLDFYNSFKMGGDSEEILDKVVPEKGYYRLTTPYNLAYHLGNRLEEKFLISNSGEGNIPETTFPKLPRYRSNRSKYLYRLKKKSIQFILKSYKLRMAYLIRLGLPGDAIKSF